MKHVLLTGLAAAVLDLGIGAVPNRLSWTFPANDSAFDAVARGTGRTGYDSTLSAGVPARSHFTTVKTLVTTLVYATGVSPHCDTHYSTKAIVVTVPHTTTRSFAVPVPVTKTTKVGITKVQSTTVSQWKTSTVTFTKTVWEDEEDNDEDDSGCWKGNDDGDDDDEDKNEPKPKPSCPKNSPPFHGQESNKSVIDHRPLNLSVQHTNGTSTTVLLERKMLCPMVNGKNLCHDYLSHKTNKSGLSTAKTEFLAAVDGVETPMQATSTAPARRQFKRGTEDEVDGEDRDSKYDGQEIDRERQPETESDEESGDGGDECRGIARYLSPGPVCIADRNADAQGGQENKTAFEPSGEADNNPPERSEITIRLNQRSARNSTMPDHFAALTSSSSPASTPSIRE